MPFTEQYINYVYFQKLKDLKDIKIEFSVKRLTAIMGVNGTGKSTILHALACCYKPSNGVTREDYKFSDFFTPNTYALWNDSIFKMNHNIRNGKTYSEGSNTDYSKKQRWNPKYVRRPERHIEFIGIDTCVPDIENERINSFITFKILDNNKIKSEEIRKIVSYILDIEYLQYNINSSTRGKKYLGVQSTKIGDYTSLSMGAGEQRVFKIIDKIINAPKYSLILIDEIDLLLHVNALKRLIETIYKLANEDKRLLQIVFTTHSMFMSELTAYVGIRYLKQTPEKTLVSDYISTDSIYQMTGSRQHPIKIYVEDKLSQAIINKVCDQTGMKRFTDIYLFGPAINSFTLICGMVLKGELHEDIVAVIDGDVYKSNLEKSLCINKILTGQAYDIKRQDVLKSIVQYNLPLGFKPERWIRELIIKTTNDVIPAENEVKAILKDICIVDNEHKYIDDAILRLGDKVETKLALVDIYKTA